ELTQLQYMQRRGTESSRVGQSSRLVQDPLAENAGCASICRSGPRKQLHHVPIRIVAPGLDTDFHLEGSHAGSNGDDRIARSPMRAIPFAVDPPVQRV